MHIDAEDIKEKYGQGRLVFEYFGELSQELVPFLFERIEKNLAAEEHVLSKVRRIAKISLEILQNTLHYQDRHELPPDVRKSLLLIYAKDGQFFIISGNSIQKANLLKLHGRLSKANRLKASELEEVYLQILDKDELRSDGAGLGIIEIMRKSQNKFRYEFFDLQKDISFFLLECLVGRDKSRETLDIIPTAETPMVHLNAPKGIMSLTGRSIPHNAISFYRPILEWFDDYLMEAQEHTEITVKLEYLNTSSSKCLLELLKKAEQITEGSRSVEVKWYFETGDDDMQEVGEDYALIVNLPFEFVEVQQI